VTTSVARAAPPRPGIVAMRHDFRDPALLRQALTHRSAGSANNERLEFLGDAVLGLLVAEALYQRHPRATEGDLTRLRAAIVREETLAVIARQLALGEQLVLGTGETRSGGHARESILADAFEAVLGAVYLDGGLDAARTAFAPLLDAQLAQFAPGKLRKDAKTELQELLQGRAQPLPVYVLVESHGEEHCKTFFVSCTAPSAGISAVGEGGSRRAAETHAAELVLARIRALEKGTATP
jgi:ribonuclease III